MTDSHDQPDARQRRRVSRLRADLGLSSLPPYVGAELRTVAPVVARQLESTWSDHAPRYAVLSPAIQKGLSATASVAFDEFARLVEDRPPVTPSVDTVLGDLLRTAKHPERCLVAILSTLEAVRGVMTELWPQLPHSRAYVEQLDAALAKYTERLCARTLDAHHLMTARPASGLRAEEARVMGLLDLIHHRWGPRQVELCVVVEALPTPTDTGGPRARPKASGPTPPHGPRALHLATRDHVVTVAPHPAPLPHPSRAARQPVCIRMGPVPADEVSLAYDTALLLFRLVRAGVARPPRPEVLPLPPLGFLRPNPCETNVPAVAALLNPLCEQNPSRRVALARTLRLRLRTAGTAQDLAQELAMHPHTVHNHFSALRALYNAELDFGDDTLPIQAALDLVLPLWEQEARSDPAPRVRPNAPPGQRRHRPPQEATLPLGAEQGAVPSRDQAERSPEPIPPRQDLP